MLHPRLAPLRLRTGSPGGLLGPDPLRQHLLWHLRIFLCVPGKADSQFMHFPAHVSLVQICNQEETCLRNAAPGSPFSSVSRNLETKQPLPCSAPPAVTRPVQGCEVLPSPGFGHCIGWHLSAARLSAPSKPSSSSVRYGALELRLSWTRGWRTPRRDANKATSPPAIHSPKAALGNTQTKQTQLPPSLEHIQNPLVSPGCAWGPIPIAMR